MQDRSHWPVTKFDASKEGDETASAQLVIAAHDAYMSNNYARFPIVMERGKGSRLWDADGKSYLDLFSGFGATILGHCHEDLVQAVTDQANKLWHVGNLLHTEPQTRLAAHLAEHGFGGKSFFCHSGADANEAAIKLARLHGKANPGKSRGEFGRYKIISATRSFHGRTFGTMPATGSPKVREGFGPLPAGFINVAYNDIAAIEAAIDDETAAVLVEPIQGEGGVIVPDADYFPQLRRLCDAHDLLLMCDEVWTGCGRTGRYFGHQHWLSNPSPSGGGWVGESAAAANRSLDEAQQISGLPSPNPSRGEGGGEAAPDVMTLGKGVGGGLAVGVCCMKPHVAELYDWSKYGVAKHATTLGGNCISMAVAARVFEVIERDKLTRHAQELGDHAMTRLRQFAQTSSAIKDVRGRGLFIGVELNPANASLSAADVVNQCLDRGLLVNATAGSVLRLAPALTIEQNQLDEGLDILEDVIVGK